MVAELMLMRHAKSDRDSRYHRDLERPLNERGREDAAKMGEWLVRNQLLPDRIISSPAVRAQQTAEQIAGHMDYSAEDIVIDNSLYGTGLEDIFCVAQKIVQEDSRPLIVAHNPALDALIEHLVGDVLGYFSNGKLMTTAAIAVFDIEGAIVPRECGLRGIIRPRELPY